MLYAINAKQMLKYKEHFAKIFLIIQLDDHPISKQILLAVSIPAMPNLISKIIYAMKLCNNYF